MDHMYKANENNEASTFKYTGECEEVTTIEFGGYQWRVLDVQGDRMLLLSEHIIALQHYHSEVKEITWAESSIRQWLNNDFISRFSEAERTGIAETNVINNDNPWFGTAGGADTIDRVFLLSIEEVVRFFGDSGQLGNRPDDALWPDGALRIDDQYNESRIARIGVGAVGAETPEWAVGSALWWWLRSPGSIPFGAASVGDDGDLDLLGSSVFWWGGGGLGVRPALWLNR